MKHYKNLMSALGDAMPVCLAWRLSGTEDNFFNARDLFAFALSDEEEEGSLKEGQFYVVSSEGAIGISSGYEYFVRWLFIPLEGNTYDQEVMRLKQELENDTKPQSVPQNAPYSQGIQQPGVQPQDVQQPNIQAQGMAMYNEQSQAYEQPQGMAQPNAQPQSEEQPRIMPQAGQRQFCIQCGYKLGPNSKFCPGCGAPVNR